MSISTFAELKTAVSSWTHRGDLSTLAADFITLADARIHFGSEDPEFPSKPLRVRGMQNRESGTVSSGTITLPTGYLETRRLVVTSNGISNELKYKSPVQLAPYETQTGVAGFYSDLNGKIYVGGTGGGSGYVHDYYKKLDTLSDSTTTNWLITNAPNVYLYGVLLEAWMFVGNLTKAQWAYRLFAAALNGLQRSDKRAISMQAGAAVAPDSYA